jgi:pyruvate-formate lyase-activating enzyme
MDGAMVDLKAIEPDVHRVLTGHGNDRVLESIRLLDRVGRLAEVRLLVIPGVNDAPEHVDATARWLVALGSCPPVTVLGFRHAGTREVARRFREATPADLTTVVERLREGGVSARRATDPARADR